MLTGINSNNSNIRKNVQLISKEDKPIVQNSAYCIGQTTDHYFIYDSATKTTTVINSNDVKQVQISK
jgi:hypothetical protein